MLQIQTERLSLIPFSEKVVRAAITHKSQLEKLLKVRVPNDWPWSETRDALPFFAKLATDPLQLGWGGWLMIHTTAQTIIGDLGFGGKPDEEGTVEMGYNVLSVYRHQGYGFEAVKSLVNWGFTHPQLKRVIATCLMDNAASIRILEKLGMQCVEARESLLKWELKKPANG